MTTVRRASPNDARSIAEVHVETWRAAYAEVLPASVLDGLDVDARERLWQRLTADPSTPVYVVEREGRIVGFAGVGPSRDADDEGELYAIYVHPEAWGTGAGPMLMSAAREWLAARYSEATLWVVELNPRARRFYEREGWVEDGRRIDVVQGVDLPEVRYRLSGLDRL